MLHDEKKLQTERVTLALQSERITSLDFRHKGTASRWWIPGRIRLLAWEVL